LGAFVTLALTSAALFPLFLPLANFIEADLRTSPLRTGIYFLPLVIATALSATFASARLLPENGPRPLIPTGMILSTMGMVLLTRITDLPNYWGHIFGGLLLVGLGLGLIVPGAIKSTFADVSPSESMDVAALVGIVLWISGALSAAFLTTVIAHVSAEPFYSTSKQGYALRHFNYVHGFSVAFWISAVLFGVGAIFSFIIFRTPSQRGEMSGASTQISGQG
jgi:MFS family permease